ncbi:MAG: hypothetical protein JSR19_12650, partial [Proteobacteria bacterium]|nr:hypothetical protein [Pseudomonadota bacterium]
MTTAIVFHVHATVAYLDQGAIRQGASLFGQLRSPIAILAAHAQTRPTFTAEDAATAAGAAAAGFTPLVTTSEGFAMPLACGFIATTGTPILAITIACPGTTTRTTFRAPTPAAARALAVIILPVAATATAGTGPRTIPLITAAALTTARSGRYFTSAAITHA